MKRTLATLTLALILAACASDEQDATQVCKTAKEHIENLAYEPDTEKLPDRSHELGEHLDSVGEIEPAPINYWVQTTTQDYKAWSDTTKDNPYGDTTKWETFADSSLKIVEVCITEGHLD